MDITDTKPHMYDIVPPANFDELTKRLHETFESDKVDVDYVRALMTSYKSTPSEWSKYAKFDPFR